MTEKKVSLVLVVAIALAAAFFGATVRNLQTAKQEPDPEIRPEFSLTDIDNKTRSIQEWDGQIVLINFWASWCPPCIKEMPALDQLRLQNLDQGFEIVGITAEPLQDAVKYLADNPVSYPILNGETSASTLGQRFGNNIGSIPFSVLIDTTGRIRHRYHGEIDLNALRAHIDELT